MALQHLPPNSFPPFTAVTYNYNTKTRESFAPLSWKQIERKIGTLLNEHSLLSRSRSIFRPTTQILNECKKRNFLNPNTCAGVFFFIRSTSIKIFYNKMKFNFSSKNSYTSGWIFFRPNCRLSHPFGLVFFASTKYFNIIVLK